MSFKLADLENKPSDKPTEDKNVLRDEADVLLGGLADGLKLAGKKTVHDIAKGAEEFVHNPVSSTVDYLKHHWQDAAAGAVIGVLAPRKWVTAALFAYSSRGFALKTINAAELAADSSVDTKQARAYYSKGIATEGSAFLASLPMAVAGGMVGKAGANAVFGKGLGAYDALSGRVAMSQVKSNIWAIHDGLKPPAIELVVTDLDGTVFNSYKAVAKGISKAIPEMSKSTGVPEERLYQLIGKEMDRAHSHDYPWSLELALKDDLKIGKTDGMSVPDFMTKVVRPFWSTFDRSFSEDLQCFETVLSTLEELKSRGVPVVGLSDAPAHAAMHRLSTVGLDQGSIERIYALQGAPEPVGLPAGMTEFGRARMNELLAREHKFKELKILPQDWEKPTPNGLQEIMNRYNVRPRQLLMIGDSRVKDLGVAYNVGAPSIWAKYGIPAPEHEAVLLRLRPLPEAGAPTGVKTYPPMVAVAERYSDLLQHLNPKPNLGEISKNLGTSLAIVPPLKSVLAHELTLPIVPDDKKPED